MHDSGGERREIAEVCSYPSPRFTEEG